MLYFDYYIIVILEVLGNNTYMKHAFSVGMRHSFHTV